MLQDLVKSHLMYAVREEVEVLKEHIKELYERNSVLERENAVLKSLANSDQLGQLSTQLVQSSSTSPPLLQQQQHPLVTNNNNNNNEGSQSVPHQPNITSAWSPFFITHIQTHTTHGQEWKILLVMTTTAPVPLAP